jgi:hypothetical protein
MTSGNANPKGEDGMTADDSAFAGARDHAAAYSAHSVDRDLVAALRLHQQVIAAHAIAPEGGYSRTPVKNIVGAVVPTQELLEAHVKHALSRIECATPSEGRFVSAGPVASDRGD